MAPCIYYLTLLYIKQTDKLCLGIALIFSVVQHAKSALGRLISEVPMSHTISHIQLVTHNQSHTISHTQLVTHNQSHTIRHTHSRQDSSQRMISSTKRSQQTQETNIHILSGIRTHDLCSRAAADLRCRPHGHRDRPTPLMIYIILKFRYIFGPGPNDDTKFVKRSVQYSYAYSVKHYIR